MRRILAIMRGGGVSHVSLDEAVVVGRQHGLDLVALDDALNALADRCA